MSTTKHRGTWAYYLTIVGLTLLLAGLNLAPVLWSLDFWLYLVGMVMLAQAVRITAEREGDR